MPQVFTVRWPHFARIEAVLFFPVALMLAIELTPLRSMADRVPLAGISFRAAEMGIPEHDILWGLMAIIVGVPYLVPLLVADRLLTVRKGFALLSIFAIAAWAGAGLQLSNQLAQFAPDSLLDGTDWLSFDTIAAIAVGFAAFLFHLPPLWIGFRDAGEVAARLVAIRDAHAYGSWHEGHGGDLYHRQTADFRRWQTPKHMAGLAGGPKEPHAARLLYGIAWIAIVAGASFTYYSRGDLAAASRAAGQHAGPVVAVPGAQGEVQVAATGIPALQAMAPPAGTAANVQAIPPLPVLPVVQRPGAPAFLDRQLAGPNEAIADRGSDGYFAFDAMVNGTHMQMQIDTGASVIAFRAEDAARLGILPAKLTYSAKVKTANGPRFPNKLPTALGRRQSDGP